MNILLETSWPDAAITIAFLAFAAFHLYVLIK